MSIDTTALQHPAEFEALCNDAKTRIHEITIDQVDALLEGGEGFCLIDVRDQDEFDSFRIESATFLSKGWIEAKIHTIVEDKDAKIVLYCGSGYRSALAADNLQKMGYQDVHSMAGGIKSWVHSGRAVVQAQS